MQDYIKRLLIVGFMALCISLLFLGGKHSQAEMLDIEELTRDWIWPAEGVVSDVYGTRHGHHKGIDIAADMKTPIHTVDKGVVTKSYYSGSYGHVVFIKHDNNLETVYAHLNKRLVSKGQTVEQGQIIGEMGSTGDSSGIHLHFEVHKQEWTYEKENAINPILALGEAAVGQPVFAMKNRFDLAHQETIARLRLVDDIEIGIHRSSILSDQAETSEGKTHIVQSGESLWTIAQKYNTSVEEITEKNNLMNSHIEPGDTIKIGISRQGEYTVAAGDTLLSIAEKTQTPVHVLKRMNRLNDDLIIPQQILITN